MRRQDIQRNNFTIFCKGIRWICQQLHLLLCQVFHQADGQQLHFLSITAILKNYDFGFPYNVLFGMGDPAGPHLRICRLYFSLGSGNDNAGNSGGRIECNHDKKFCLQSRNAHGQDRNNGHLGKSGHGTPPDRF
jgi:hypothetical protein